MQQTEIYLTLILTTAIVIIFVIGIFYFIILYKKRKEQHNTEQTNLIMQHQQQLQEATLQMQQLTMQDIGREIHDGVGQRLTLASIYSKQPANKTLPENSKEKISEISSILSESLSQLRARSKELTNEVDYATSLDTVLSLEIEKLKNLQVCEVKSSIQSNIWLPHKTTMFIIRIVQEFFQNSLKYAECSTLNIHLSQMEDTIYLHLSDDGIGFDIQSETEGIGLKNMIKRAALIQAKADITSVINQGTQLKLYLTI